MQESQVPPLGQEIPWGREWLHTPVLLPGKFHGQKSPPGYSPWSHKGVRYDLAPKEQQQSDGLGLLELSIHVA